jgi:hypothetical protein
MLCYVHLADVHVSGLGVQVYAGLFIASVLDFGVGV